MNHDLKPYTKFSREQQLGGFMNPMNLVFNKESNTGALPKKKKKMTDY